MNKALCFFFLFVVTVGCNEKPSFSTYRNIFPGLSQDTMTIIPFQYTCEKQKSLFPKFALDYREFLYHFPANKNDTFNIAWPISRIKLKNGNDGLIVGSCSIDYDEGPPGYYFFIFNGKGDSVQYFLMNPFLYEEAHDLAIMYRQEKITTLYEDVERKKFLRMTWSPSGNSALYSSAIDTLNLEQFKTQYPGIEYKKWPFEKKTDTGITIKADTIYHADCDIDSDGKQERIFIIDAVPDNSNHEYKNCYTVLIQKQRDQGGWFSWTTSGKGIPAMNDRSTAYPGEYKCGKGFFSFWHIDEGQNQQVFRFEYDEQKKNLVLRSVKRTDSKGVTTEHAPKAPVSLADFDFMGDYGLYQK